jgi:hypothetical protein
MKQLVLQAVLAVTVPASAWAQELPRFEVGPVTRLERISLEGGAKGSTVAAGVAASVRLWSGLGVEAEVTQASRQISRSYEGWFVSYNQDRNATRAEIEAMAPTARRTLGYSPGLGWSAAVVARGRATERMTMAARLGVSARRYQQTSSYVILTMPEGLDPARVARDFQNSAGSRTRGGLLFGVDASIALTDHLAIVPDLRFVYGGPARVGNNYREFGLGTRAAWRF